MAIESKNCSEKNILREVSFHREISPNQFTDILRTLEIPTQRTRLEFTPKENHAKNHNRAFIEWHRESGYTLAELRKYEGNDSFPLLLPRDVKGAQKDIIIDGSTPITLDIFEKKLKPGQGFREFQENKLPALKDAGYTVESGVLILRDKGLLGSLDVAALHYKDGQLSLTLDNLMGKRFTNQLNKWWHTLPTNHSEK